MQGWEAFVEAVLADLNGEGYPEVQQSEDRQLDVKWGWETAWTNTRKQELL